MSDRRFVLGRKPRRVEIPKPGAVFLLGGEVECGLGEADGLPWNAVFAAGAGAGKSLQMKGNNTM